MVKTTSIGDLIGLSLSSHQHDISYETPMLWPWDIGVPSIDLNTNIWRNITLIDLAKFIVF